MALDLADFDRRARGAVRRFWQTREQAGAKQKKEGKTDQGTRGTVTAGKHMDGFADLLEAVIAANGLAGAEHVARKGRLRTLPGYFRPTKSWDLIVMNKGRLVAALEFKSQVGSLGNNANNRAEEVIGLGVDLWKAYREGAFGEDAPQPFVGYLFLLEDSDGSRRPISEPDPFFAMFPEFADASYATRYDLLCRKMVQEQIYTAAAVLLSPRTARTSGVYTEMHTSSGLKNFVTTIAGHIAAEAAR